MDLENRVSRQLNTLPTASRCCEAGTVWDFSFQRSDSESQHTGIPVPRCVTKPIANGTDASTTAKKNNGRAKRSPNTEECSAPATPYASAFTLGRSTPSGPQRDQTKGPPHLPALHRPAAHVAASRSRLGRLSSRMKASIMLPTSTQRAGWRKRGIAQGPEMRAGQHGRRQ
jgi:hypothetical protein